MDSLQHDVRLDVTPEPTDEEMAAIVSAVMTLQSHKPSTAGQPQADAGPPKSRWASAGRRQNIEPFEVGVGSKRDVN